MPLAKLRSHELAAGPFTRRRRSDLPGASWADFTAVRHIVAVEQMFGAVEQVWQVGWKDKGE